MVYPVKNLTGILGNLTIILFLSGRKNSQEGTQENSRKKLKSKINYR
jgi:hypothetical protein